MAEPDTQYHIQFGLGVRLAHESWFIDEAFRGALSVEAFRLLCRRLHVPMVHLRGERYVDVHRFELAMTAICRIGEPDFVFPESSTDDPHTERLDLEKFKAEWKQVVAELLAAKECNSVKVTGSMVDAASRAAEMLVTHAVSTMPARMQKRRAAGLASDSRLVSLAWLQEGTQN